ncbi:MAG: TolC family protein [Bacteroidota bacterium]
MEKFKISLIVIFFSCVSMQAQSAWDLEQCIVYAKNHNISLKQSNLNNQITLNNADQSKLGLLPSVNAAATHQYNFGQTIDRYTNSFVKSQAVLSQNFYLSSSVVLWSGMAQYNNIKANEYNYLSGVERLKQQENDLSLSVANAYIGVIFSEEIVKISHNQYQITKEQLDRTQKLVSAGSVAKSEEYNILAQLANEEVNVTAAENNYNLSLLNLKQLMNFDSVTNFNIARPDLNMQEALLLENNLTSIYETALKNQPSIKSSQYSILSSEKYLLSSRGRVSPSLSFNASMGTGTSGLAKKVVGYQDQTNVLQTSQGNLLYTTQIPILVSSPFSEQFKNNANKSIGFTLSLPLYNGFQTATSIKNAKINSLNARFSMDLAKQNLYKSIAQAHANAKAALNKYKATTASVKAANESFFYAQQKFNAGVISSYDFNSAKSKVFTAECNMLQDKYDYIFKLKVIDYYLGKPLSL